MTDVSTRNFGYLIAYVIPGFVVVAAGSAYSSMIRSWFGGPIVDFPTVGGFLYTTLASVACGMTVSAIRWLVLDFIHHRTGVAKAAWNLAAFEDHHAAVVTLVEQHYRYYQFYGNMLIAILVSAAAPRALLLLFPVDRATLWWIIGVVAVLYFLASRDALKKYYSRSSALLDCAH